MSETLDIDVGQLQLDNERMVHALAVVAENRRLRVALASAGLPVPIERRPTLLDLATIIAEQHGFSVEDLRDPSCQRDLVAARQHFMWSARQEKHEGRHRWTLAQIGKFLGGRDHTTVGHGAERHEQRMAGVVARRAEEGL